MLPGFGLVLPFWPQTCSASAASWRAILVVQEFGQDSSTVPRLEAVRLKDLCFLMTARIGVALGFQLYRKCECQSRQNKGGELMTWNLPGGIDCLGDVYSFSSSGRSKLANIVNNLLKLAIEIGTEFFQLSGRTLYKQPSTSSTEDSGPSRRLIPTSAVLYLAILNISLHCGGKRDVHGRGSRLEQMSFLDHGACFPLGGNEASIKEGLRWLLSIHFTKMVASNELWNKRLGDSWDSGIVIPPTDLTL